MLLNLILLTLTTYLVKGTTYCDLISPPVPPCENNSPRDLIFLVDGSNSMKREHFYGEMIEYTQALYCAFDPSQPNQAGMIVFNKEIKTWIELDLYTQNEWFEKTNEVKDSEGQVGEACCSCCTPTAEAFDAALDMFNSNGKNEIKIAFVITDGVPSNNDAGTGGNPAWWYISDALGYNPARYNAEVVPQQAALLKQVARILLVGVPNYLDQPPDVDFFAGTGIYQNVPRQIKVQRNKKVWYYTYNKPPNPIVSLPVSKNAFSSNSWEVADLVAETVNALCDDTQKPTMKPTMMTLKPTTKSPTTKQPTRLPTRSPLPLFFDQIDLTFIIDRSNSMNWQNTFCESIRQGLPNVFLSDKPSTSACWELFMRYILDQSDSVAAIDNAGANHDRDMGWANEYVVNGKGLRVQVVGFACENKQKTPKVFDFSDDFNNGQAITSRSRLLELLEYLRLNVSPFGGTCPGLSIEQSVKYVERSPFQTYPYQSAILVTDGVFYDMPFPQRATQGLEAYKVLRFAIGIAVANKDNNYGMTPQEIETQKQQLNAFVGTDGSNRLKILGTQGWALLLKTVSTEIATELGHYTDVQGAIPRYTWCGWRRVNNCQSDSWRQGHCKWKGGKE